MNKQENLNELSKLIEEELRRLKDKQYNQTSISIKCDVEPKKYETLDVELSLQV